MLDGAGINVHFDLFDNEKYYIYNPASHISADLLLGASRMYKILKECGTVAIGSSELLQELLQLIAVEYQGSFWELMTIYETQGIEMIPDSSDVPNSSTSYW